MPAANGQAVTERPRTVLDGAQEMVVHRHLSGQVLPRGLYVGLLQLRSTRDAISVLVSRHQPNVLPYVRVRDNPNITRYVRRARCVINLYQGGYALSEFVYLLAGLRKKILNRF